MNDSPNLKSSRQRALRRWRFFLLACCLTAAPLFAQPGQTGDAAALLERVDRHYNALQSLSVHFVQHYDGMGMHRTEAGILLLKKPGRMRWTYSQPDGKLFILDGRDGYFYSPGASEAQRVPEKKLDDLRSPLRFLLGHTQLAKELKDVRVAPGANGTFVISGVPKGLEQRVSSMRITATADGTIRAMTLEETDGVTNTFDFSGELPNAPAPGSAFVFTPPPGVHVVNGMSPV